MSTYIGTMGTPFGLSDIRLSAYDNGSPSVELVNQEGDLVAYLSMNLPYKSQELQEGEFFARDDQENTDLAQLALATGLFEDTGKISQVSNIQHAKIWKTVPRES